MTCEAAPFAVEVIQKLGEGNYGSVHLVRIEPLRKKYAMKVLNSSAISKKQRDQIKREVEIMSILRHPNVIRYKRAFVTSGESEIHVIMEYADLGDLSTVIKDKENWEVSSVQLHDWFFQILSGLDYIHCQKVIHRDIKPSNLLLKSSCGCGPGCQDRTAVKIGDFGVSTVLRRDADYKTATSIGTPYYLSPEICQGLEYGFKSDIWSLGCVLYELLSGRPPFMASTIELLVQKIISGQYPKIASNADPELSSLLPKLLTVTPEDRPSAAFLKHMFSLRMDKRAIHMKKLAIRIQQRQNIRGVNESVKEGVNRSEKVNAVKANVLVEGRNQIAAQPSQGARKQRRCFSAVENGHQPIKTPKGRDDNQNIFKFDQATIAKHNEEKKQKKVNSKLMVDDQEPQSTSPKIPSGKLDETKNRIDELLTRLDIHLGAELLGRCVDVYRETKSITELKQVLGSENIAFLSSVLRLVYLEDQIFNGEAHRCKPVCF